MPDLETDTKKVVVRLLRDGWRAEHGSKHDKLSNPARSGVTIMVPRHKTLSAGVARSIARAAGWI